MPKFQLNYYATVTQQAFVEVEAASWAEAKAKVGSTLEDVGVAGLDWEQTDGIDNDDIHSDVFMLSEDGQDLIEEGSEHDSLSAPKVIAIVFKHEDRIRRQPIGPVFNKMSDGSLVSYQDHETTVSVVSKKPIAKWFSLAEARAFAKTLGVPLEES